MQDPIVKVGVQGVGNGYHGYSGCSCISYSFLAYIGYRVYSRTQSELISTLSWCRSCRYSSSFRLSLIFMHLVFVLSAHQIWARHYFVLTNEKLFFTEQQEKEEEPEKEDEPEVG